MLRSEGTLRSNGKMIGKRALLNLARGKNIARLFVAGLLTAYCLLPSAYSASASDPGTGEWPMWGGTPDRNMVSKAKGMPTSWDVKTKKNVKWVAELGSQTYGNITVAGGVVLVGTNNEAKRDPKVVASTRWPM